jgi:hypothetical protein
MNTRKPETHNDPRDECRGHHQPKRPLGVCNRFDVFGQTLQRDESLRHDPTEGECSAGPRCGACLGAGANWAGTISYGYANRW